MSLREAQKAFTRARIVEAAVRTFEAKGYPAATVDDIVAEAGASRATFYVHFKNKEEVARAIFEVMVPQNAAAYTQLDDAIAAGSTPLIRAWVGEALQWWDANRGAVLALEQIVASGGFGHGGLDQVQTHAMPKLLAAWGDDQREQVSMRIYLLNSLITRAHRAWRIDGLFSGLDDDAVVELIADMWISGLELPRVMPDGDWS